MALKEVKTKSENYFIDAQDRKQGEYRSYYYNGQLRVHCYYVDGKYNGEYRSYHVNGLLRTHCYCVDDQWHGEYRYYKNGQLQEHAIYAHGNKLDINPNTLTDKDKFLLTIKHGVQWL